MTTTSFLTEKQQTLLQPDEELMFERKFRDRAALRRELAPVTELPMGDRYVEEGDSTYVDAHSDMPTVDTGIGEQLGNVDVVRYTGDRVRVPRMAHGLTVEEEDLEVEGGAEELRRERDTVMELFDVQADLQFLLGITDEEGNTVQPGVFDWIDSNIAADHVIDASSFDVDADLNGQAANIIVQEAYSRTEGEYIDTTWDMAVAKHPIWSNWNQIDDNSGESLASQWVDIDNSDQFLGVGVENTLNYPESHGLRTAPDQPDSLRFDLEFPSRTNSGYSSPLSDASDDAMYLIPDHGGDFWELYEQPTVDQRDSPIQLEGFRERYEYKWRAGQVFNFGHRNEDNLYDLIKIENVTSLF